MRIGIDIKPAPIQFVVRSNLLREVDESVLINKYAKQCVFSEDDVTNKSIIKGNLLYLLDWERSKEFGLQLFSGKFETIGRYDLGILANVIFKNQKEILRKASLKKKNKEIALQLENKLAIRKQFVRYMEGEIPTHPRRKGCEYNGQHYDSRQQCMALNGLTKAQLYKYLAETNQLTDNSPLAKFYK